MLRSLIHRELSFVQDDKYSLCEFFFIDPSRILFVESIQHFVKKKNCLISGLYFLLL